MLLGSTGLIIRRIVYRSVRTAVVIMTLDYAVLQICLMMQVMYASTALSDATAAQTKAFVHLAKNCVTGDPRGRMIVEAMKVGRNTFRN